MKVPERFLGYAFCVGDILVELDDKFIIQNADGAVKTLLGDGEDTRVGTSVLEYFPAADQDLIRRASQSLNGQNRLGPIKVAMRTSSGDFEDFAVFLTRLPIAKNRLFMVVSRQYRLGIDGEQQAEKNISVSDKRATFIENMEALFDQGDEASEKLLVTVMEAMDSGGLSAEETAQVERYLSGFSVGGNHATQLEDNKFAIIHERGADDTAEFDSKKIAEQVTAATGLELSSATIDAKTAGLNSRDSVKALAFSLQQFANGSDGFDLETIAGDPSTLLGETTQRVTSFRDILDKGAFSLVYQPIVDLKTEKIHHYEALSRFDQRDEKINAFEMITFAEDVGMIAEFDMAVLLRAIDKLHSIRRHGVMPSLAVNVSGKSLSSADFMADFTAVLQENSDLVEYLSLEITESAKIENLDRLADQLALIRGQGFHVYLDDFGAGVSGFQYLRKLQVDALKIDGAYIKDALTSDMDRAFLRAMVSLCQELNITTVGEWVETREHAELLKSLGVDYAQGYYYGKPKNGIGGERRGTAQVA